MQLMLGREKIGFISAEGREHDGLTKLLRMFGHVIHQVFYGESENRITVAVH